MKITIKHNKQEYTIYGVRAVESMAGNKNGLFFYLEEKVNGRWTAYLKNAKIISVNISSLDWTYTQESVWSLLGI